MLGDAVKILVYHEGIRCDIFEEEEREQVVIE